MNVKTLSIPLFLILFCCMLGCRNKHHNKMYETARDLPQIKDSGELVVLTLYSSTSYFIYRGHDYCLCSMNPVVRVLLLLRGGFL